MTVLVETSRGASESRSSGWGGRLPGGIGPYRPQPVQNWNFQRVTQVTPNIPEDFHSLHPDPICLAIGLLRSFTTDHKTNIAQKGGEKKYFCILFKTWISTNQAVTGGGERVANERPSWTIEFCSISKSFITHASSTMRKFVTFDRNLANTASVQKLRTVLSGENILLRNRSPCQNIMREVSQIMSLEGELGLARESSRGALANEVWDEQ